MSSYFILADIHWQKKTLDRLNETFEWIHGEIIKKKPKRILFLGDLNQHRNSIDIQVQDAVSKWIEKFLETPSNPTIHLLVGNHDMVDLDSRDINSINVFQHRRSRVLVHSNLEIVNLDGHNYLMAPYHHDQTPIANFLDENAYRAAELVILGHLSVDSAVMYGASDRSKKLCVRSGLTIPQLAKFKQVFMGHFHFHKSYAEGKVVYVGSVIQTDFGEAGNIEKGYIEYTPTTNQWNLVHNPYAHYYINWTWDEYISKSKTQSELQLNVKDRAVQLCLSEDEMGRVGSHACQQALTSLQHAGASIRKLKRIAIRPRMSQSAKVSNPEGNDFDIPQSTPTIAQLLDRWFELPVNVCTNHIEEKKQFLEILMKDQSNASSSSGLVSFEGKIRSVSITNFMSVKETQILDFGSLSSTLYILHGFNGHGKSTLLESICWCLFGKTMRGITGDKIIFDPLQAPGIKSKTRLEACVTITFNNNTIVTRKRSAKEHVSIQLASNSEPIMRSSTKETTKFIAQTLGIDFETFLRTCMVDSDSLKAIFSSDPSKKEQNFMESILSLPVHHYWQLCVTKGKVLQKDVELLENDYKNMETSSHALHEKQIELLQKSSYWKTKREQTEASLQLSETEYNSKLDMQSKADGNVKSLEFSLRDHNTKQNHLQDLLIHLSSQTQRLEAVNRLKAIENTIHDWQTEVSECSVETLNILLLNLERDKVSLNKQLKDAAQLETELTMNNDIKSRQQSDIKNQIHHAEEKVHNLNQELSVLQEQRSRIATQIYTQQKICDKRIEEICDQIDLAESELNKKAAFDMEMVDMEMEVRKQTRIIHYQEKCKILLLEQKVRKSQEFWAKESEVNKFIETMWGFVKLHDHESDGTSSAKYKTAIKALVDQWKQIKKPDTNLSTEMTRCLLESNFPYCTKDECNQYVFQFDETDDTYVSYDPIALVQAKQNLEEYQTRLDHLRQNSKEYKLLDDNFLKKELAKIRNDLTSIQYVTMQYNFPNDDSIVSSFDTNATSNLQALLRQWHETENSIQGKEIQKTECERVIFRERSHVSDIQSESILVESKLKYAVGQKLLIQKDINRIQSDQSIYEKQRTYLLLLNEKDELSHQIKSYGDPFVNQSDNDSDISIQNLQEKVKQTKQEVEQVERKLENAKHISNTLRQECQALMIEIAKLKMQYDCFEQEADEMDATYRIVEKEWTELQEPLQSLSEKIQNTLFQLSLVQYWIKQLNASNDTDEITTTFRQFCVSEPLKYVNRMIAVNMARLTERDTLFTENTMDCVIGSKLKMEQGKQSRDLNQRSSGQRKRNQFAAFLTLFLLFREQHEFKSHFIFFDETFENLDQPGSEALLTWLKEEAEALDITIFIVTQHVEKYDSETNVIKVFKDAEDSGTKFFF